MISFTRARIGASWLRLWTKSPSHFPSLCLTKRQTKLVDQRTNKSCRIKPRTLKLGVTWLTTLLSLETAPRLLMLRSTLYTVGQAQPTSLCFSCFFKSLKRLESLPSLTLTLARSACRSRRTRKLKMFSRLSLWSQIPTPSNEFNYAQVQLSQAKITRSNVWDFI